tara:strand:- start:743 stop:979 length:237 start_codon:yes stop_codon:yes gene_type:complete
MNASVVIDNSVFRSLTVASSVTGFRVRKISETPVVPMLPPRGISQSLWIIPDNDIREKNTDPVIVVILEKSAIPSTEF